MPYVRGALQQLIQPTTWQGTPEEIAAAQTEAATIIAQMTEGVCAVENAPTPYWDSSTDVDDQEPPDAQPWYGVSGGGGFIEDFGVWVVSGFLAESIGPQAAIVYQTFERRVRLAFLAGGPAGLVKVIFDNFEEILDLTGEDEEVREFDFVGNPELETHTLEIINEGAP